jgi:hypothetical protein
MKKICLSFVFLLAAVCGFSQEQTLFSNENARIGGFGGPIFEYSTIKSDFGTAGGGGGGIVINDFFLGGFGLGGNFAETVVDNDVFDVNYGYGGLWFGYTYPSSNLVHGYVDMKLGWGGADLTEKGVGDNFEREDGDDFFVVIPQVGLELNIFQWFRINGTVGYRFSNGLDDIENLQDSDFEGVIGGLTLRFGWFAASDGDNYDD